jgi:hypothetical protein
MSYDGYWSQTLVIDVHLSLYLAAILDLILFPFPLTPAEFRHRSVNWYWCCKHNSPPDNAPLVLVLQTNTTITLVLQTQRKFGMFAFP